MNFAFEKIDKGILIASILMLAAGIVFVYSSSFAFAATKFHDPEHFLANHLIRAVLALGCFVLFLGIDYRILGQYSHIWFIGAVVLLVAALLMPASNGAHRWVNLGLFSFQASEFARIALVIVLASQAEKMATRIREQQVYISQLVKIGVICGLIVIEPNFSTAALIGIMGVAMLLVAGARMKHLMFTLMPLLVVALGVLVMQAYRLKRLKAFFYYITGRPEVEFLVDGKLQKVKDIIYQQHQALIGLGHGGIFGTGLGSGSQKYGFLPELHTDFVFSILGEEVGFLGMLVVLSVFGFIVWRGMRIAFRSTDVRSSCCIRTFAHFGDVCDSSRIGQRLSCAQYRGAAAVLQLRRHESHFHHEQSRYPSQYFDENTNREGAVMKVVITAGGTGGHIFPALATALELRRRIPDVDLVWIGTARSREVELCREHGIRIELLKVQGINKKFSLATVKALFNYLRASSIMRSRFKKDRPDVVVAFGGYVCAPVLRAARAAKIPYCIHEQNAAMGRVNRAFVKGASCTFLGYPLAHGAKLVTNPLLCGTPVKPLARTYEKFTYPEGFVADRKCVLICGGSQGAASMNDALVSAVRRLLANGHQVIWQTGAVSYPKLTCMFAGASGIFIFESMADMYPYYRVAKLLLCRAGASTLSEAAFFGLPCVMIPLPWAAGNHQWHNAGYVEQQGWGIRVSQDQHCSDNAEKAVDTILSTAGRYAAMAEKAKASSPEPAAGLIASRLILDMKGV